MYNLHERILLYVNAIPDLRTSWRRQDNTRKTTGEGTQCLRLCPDEWITQILADPHDIPELDRLRSPVESLQWDVAKRALVLGVNAILENGFWSREERNYFRNEAEGLGANVELHYLDVDIDELWRRISKRNAELPPDTFHVSRENLKEWAKSFETPSEDEMPFLTHRP
jgi:predicted kinase